MTRNWYARCVTDLRKRGVTKPAAATPAAPGSEPSVSELLRDYERWLAARPADAKSLETELDEYFAEHPMSDEDRAWADRALGLASE